MVENGIEYLKFSDGSHRWLWSVCAGGRVWRAGVEHRLEDAKRSAANAWVAYLAKLQDAERLKLPSAVLAEILDVDRLERGPGDSDDPA